MKSRVTHSTCTFFFFFVNHFLPKDEFQVRVLRVSSFKKITSAIFLFFFHIIYFSRHFLFARKAGSGVKVAPSMFQGRFRQVEGRSASSVVMERNECSDMKLCLHSWKLLKEFCVVLVITFVV